MMREKRSDRNDNAHCGSGEGYNPVSIHFPVPSMRLLAIETATDACSAALWLDGEIRLAHLQEQRRQSELILGLLDQLLAEAGLGLSQLDAIAFGRGPGSFTGVRIAAGVAQGVAFAADLPVVPVSTLAALSHRAGREMAAEWVLPAYDARMGEVYWGGYRVRGLGSVELVLEEGVYPPALVPVPSESPALWTGVGSGWAAYREILEPRLAGYLDRIEPGLGCSAEDVAWLGVTGFRQGATVAPELAIPVYLRDQVARKPGGR